jgi:hypothetical protein
MERITTECAVPECDHESLILWMPWPTGGCCAVVKKSVISIVTISAQDMDDTLENLSSAFQK